MKTVDLNKVLEMLINEEQNEASGLLHEWFVERSKQIHEELMAEDNTLSQDIEDDQEAIKSEEFYSEDEGDDVADDAEELDGEVEVGGDELPADDMVGAEELPAEELPAEATISDTIEDLQAVMARLKAEFDAIAAGGDAGDDMDAGEPVDVDMDADVAGDDAGIEDETLEDSMTFESADEDDDDKEEVTESEDDFADLDESWTLEPVKDPNLQGGKEIGADGAKVALNDKSPLPEHDADARVGGKAVEIKSSHHEGHEREPSPEVKGKPLLKNQVKKATDGRTKVSKEGDKSATLNSKAGFGSDSPKSPIGQATDLRGSDFKRK